MSTVRPCGCTTDTPGHTEPEPDWIGDTPIIHGESEHPIPGTTHTLHGYPSLPDNYCLCGHAPYQHCPGWLQVEGSDAWGGSVMDLEIGPA